MISVVSVRKGHATVLHRLPLRIKT